MVAVTAFATFAAGVAAWFTTRGILIAAIDQSLRERAAGLARGGISDGLLSGRFTPPPRPDGPDAFLLVRENGQEIFRSEGLPAGRAVAELVVAPDTIAASTLADGMPVRACTVQAPVRSRCSWRESAGAAEEPVRNVDVLILHSTAHIHVNLRQLAGVLGGLWLLACALAGIAAWSARRGILRPVARLVRAIARNRSGHSASATGDRRRPCRNGGRGATLGFPARAGGYRAQSRKSHHWRHRP